MIYSEDSEVRIFPHSRAVAGESAKILPASAFSVFLLKTAFPKKPVKPYFRVFATFLSPLLLSTIYLLLLYRVNTFFEKHSYTVPLAMPRKPTYADKVDPKVVGNRLRRLRTERGITQVELAKKMKMRQALISDYELGKLRMHSGVIVGFAKALKVSTDELLGLKKSARNGYFKDRRFLRRLNKVEKLSRRDKEALLGIIDAFIARVPDDN